MPHPEVLNTLRPGDTVLLDDGKLRFTVVATGPCLALLCPLCVRALERDRDGKG